MVAPEESDLTNDIVAELGRLSLLVEATQASNLSLQVQIDALKERVATLEKERIASESKTPNEGARYNREAGHG